MKYTAIVMVALAALFVSVTAEARTLPSICKTAKSAACKAKCRAFSFSSAVTVTDVNTACGIGGAVKTTSNTDKGKTKGKGKGKGKAKAKAEGLTAEELIALKETVEEIKKSQGKTWLDRNELLSLLFGTWFTLIILGIYLIGRLRPLTGMRQEMSRKNNALVLKVDELETEIEELKKNPPDDQDVAA